MKEKSIFLFSKIICVAISAITIISFGSIPVFAKAYVQTWDLVDSGKHLDYDGSSQYMSYINTGATTWNGYKSGVIRADSISVIQDVYVSDINTANGYAGKTYSNGKIHLNKYYLKNYTDEKRTNVAAHELGHALGLDHSTSSDLMDGNIANHVSLQSLSKNDKDSYDEAYANY